MGDNRYTLRWLHDNKNEELAFNGHALRPVAVAPDGPAIFELVAERRSITMELNLVTRIIRPFALGKPYEIPTEVVSPNGKWVAFTSTEHGSTQVWIRSLIDGHEQRLTGGDCNNSSPVWELDSKAIIFASDCDRAYGLTTLYRAPLQLDH